jgi:DNA-binding MarR family transcriptional regulator/ATP:corrinoid adenosyltransferase
MPIPSQNDFLQPFLQLLIEGQSLTRAQIMFRLAKHFNISQDEAQQMSGSQYTLVSRVAWCDVHFCKAGFVTKTQHPHDSMQDTFRITSLGIRELRRHADRLTVGYLQSFYRGNVYRGAGADDATSEAERVLSEKFEALSPEFTVVHSVKWIAKGAGTVGEADFLIAHPRLGVLVLEVKGGQISIQREGNSSQWYSTDQYGCIHPIHDPCEQADRSRRALKDWLKEDPRTNGSAFSIFPAVALPDVRVAQALRPDCPAEIFIDITHLDHLETRLLEIFAYWQQHADRSNQRMDGKTAVQALIDLLVPTRKLQPRIADIFERERRKIEELTQQQFHVLKMLKRHKRAAIVGGAGTGKTLLAMEKAQQLADAGYRVLFVCFNRNLAEWLGKHLTDEHMYVSTYHSLVAVACEWAKMGRGWGQNWDEFSAKAPDYLIDAASIIRTPGSGVEDKLFDAIIVDEAQDFEDTWWISLPELLRNPVEDIFYVFFDDNQRLYTQISNVPVAQEPFYLLENCRNTQHIHVALLPYARDYEETECNGPEGRSIEVIPAPGPKVARAVLQSTLHRLVHDEGVDPAQIIVLTPSSERRSQWKPDTQLGNFILTWDMETEMRNAIRVSTIYRFKGLESAVVILTEMEQGREEILTQLVYVGLSRARHHVVVIGVLPKVVSKVD